MKQRTALIFLACAFACAPTTAAAHDYEHPELAPWFMSLQSRSKTPCCDGSEAQHLADVEWRTRDGHYQVFLEGDWRDVPDTAIVDGPNRDGTALVWTYFVDGKNVGIRCFMPGAGS